MHQLRQELRQDMRLVHAEIVGIAVEREMTEFRLLSLTRESAAARTCAAVMASMMMSFGSSFAVVNRLDCPHAHA